MGKHRKARAEGEEIGLGQYTGLGVDKEQRQCRRWEVSGLKGGRPRRASLLKCQRGVVAVPQTAKGGSKSGLKGNLRVWPFMSPR